MSVVGSSFVMFGGLYVPQQDKKVATNAEPTDEVYTLRIGASKYLFFYVSLCRFNRLHLIFGYSPVMILSKFICKFWLLKTLFEVFSDYFS
jgi:hypothetical protein